MLVGVEPSLKQVLQGDFSIGEVDDGVGHTMTLEAAYDEFGMRRIVLDEQNRKRDPVYFFSDHHVLRLGFVVGLTGGMRRLLCMFARGKIYCVDRIRGKKTPDLPPGYIRCGPRNQRVQTGSA